MSSTRKITLTSSDGQKFEVDDAVAQQSRTIMQMIEVDNGIRLPIVTGEILAKVIEYCKKQVETPNAEGGAGDDELKNWDAEFVKVDRSTLFDLMRAADYWNIKGLLDLTRQAVVDVIMQMILAMTMGMIPDDIIKTVFTP